jgi:TrmH family RNA methyltransferase
LKPSGIITSRRNALVEELRSLREDRESSFLFLEGPRLVKEALQSGQKIDTLIWVSSEDNQEVLSAASPGSRRAYQVSESVFKALSDVESPQGLLAIISRPKWEWKNLLSRAPLPIVILDGIQDPGNLATIIRTAEAAGASGVVTTPGTARLYSPKALRGAMGSTLRLPCLELQSISEIHRELNKASYQIYAASMKSTQKTSIAYTSIDWKKPVALLLGREGSGFLPEWNPLIGSWLHIPMRPPVESLNVAAAAAILLYEFARHNS